MTMTLDDRAIQETAKPWMLLIQELPVGNTTRCAGRIQTLSWSASQRARFERLLRETEVPIGLLTNTTLIQLIYAPRVRTRER